jgi:hypothetical protein
MFLLHVCLHTNFPSCPLHIRRCYLGRKRLVGKEDELFCAKVESSMVQSIGMFIRQVCLSLMARLEYAAMEKQGQHKLRRESAMVQVECKSVLVHLMANMQERKINNVGIMARKDQKHKLHFGVSDTGKLRSQELRLFNTGVPELQNLKSQKGNINKSLADREITPFQSFGYWEIEKSRVETLQQRSLGVAKSRISNSRNSHINEEFRRPGNNSILEFRILGVGRVKTLHHQESRNHEMRNVEILEEGGKFRVPGVGRVNTLYH